MTRLFFILVLASTPVFAGPFDEMLKEMSKAIAEDADKHSSGTKDSKTGATNATGGQVSGQRLLEAEIPTRDKCDGINPAARMQDFASCHKTRATLCTDWLKTIPISPEGESTINLHFNERSNGKCNIARMLESGFWFRNEYVDSNIVPLYKTYFSILDSKQSEFAQLKKRTQVADCMSRLEEIPIADGSSKLIDNLSPNCPYKDAGFENYKAKREAKLKQISPIETEAQAKQHAGLIQKHAKAVRAPANFLASVVAVQWGGALGFPLIQFIDSVQTNPRSKATYEMNGKSLIMRHRITDPVKRKSVDVVYVFVPDSNEAVLSRLVWDGTEIPMKDIPQMFLQIAVGMKNG